MFSAFPASQDLRFVAHLMTRKHRNGKTQLQTSSSQFIHTPMNKSSEVTGINLWTVSSYSSFFADHSRPHMMEQNRRHRNRSMSPVADGGVPHPQMGYKWDPCQNENSHYSRGNPIMGLKDDMRYHETLPFLCTSMYQCTIPTLQDLYITRLKTKIERPKKCVAKMIVPLNNFQRHFEKGPKPPRFQPAPVASGSGGVGLALLSAAA